MGALICPLFQGFSRNPRKRIRIFDCVLLKLMPCFMNDCIQQLSQLGGIRDHSDVHANDAISVTHTQNARATLLIKIGNIDFLGVYPQRFPQAGIVFI